MGASHKNKLNIQKYFMLNFTTTEKILNILIKIDFFYRKVSFLTYFVKIIHKRCMFLGCDWSKRAKIVLKWWFVSVGVVLGDGKLV